MDIKDLMIGDWVQSKAHNGECLYTRINALDSRGENKHIISSNRWIEDDAFRPIPLTIEILEKNGWERDYDKEWKYNNSHCFPTYRYQWEKERFKIETNANRDGFTIPDIIGHRFYYVHQLQHILRLCGMNELADNFKV